MDPLCVGAPEATEWQGVEVARIIHRYFKWHGVDKAMDMPEEARLRLCRDLQAYFTGKWYIGCRFDEWRLEMANKIRRFFSSFRP